VVERNAAVVPWLERWQSAALPSPVCARVGGGRHRMLDGKRANTTQGLAEKFQRYPKVN
jgi:hypothetical protein